VVSDAHGDMGNILPQKLDQRADLVQGTPKTPLSMMTGIGEEFSLAVFIGYHAGAGTPMAILDHTYTGFFTDVRVNGEAWNETHLNAALAGTFGVPVGMVSGDRACCEQAKERLPWVRTIVVKEGLGNRVGIMHSPSRARAAIRGLMRETIKGLEKLEVFRPEGPFTLEIDYGGTAGADMASLMPGTERAGPRTTRYTSASFDELYRALLTWMNLVGRVAPAPVME
jgi:D-amino peptidase